MRIRLLRAWGVGMALLGALACSEVGSPSGGGTVRLSLQTGHVVSGQSLEVIASYRRTDQSSVSLGTQRFALENTRSQTLSVEINIGPCLADPNRDESQQQVCPLLLTLVLRNALDEVLDSFVLGPLHAEPGHPLNPPAVSLRQPASITLSAPAGTVSVGQTLQVTAVVTDRSNTTLTRALDWSSSNPSIASVSASGLVTGVTSGDFTVTASLHGVSDVPAGTLALRSIASRLAIAAAPSAAPQSGIPFFAQPAIQLKDGNGNNFAQASVAVTVSLLSGPGTLSGTLTVSTDATGKATFTDLTLTSATSGPVVLRFAASGYSPVSSTSVTLNGSPNPPAAPNGVESGRLAAANGGQLYFTALVPANAVELAFLLYGGTGNAELYARRTAWPTQDTFDCRSNATGPVQRCDISSARSGQWFVVINAASAISDELFRVLAYGPECAKTPIPLNTTLSGALALTDCKVPFRFVTSSVYDRYLLSLVTATPVLFQSTSTNTINLSLKPRDLSRWYFNSATTTTPMILAPGDYDLEVYDASTAQQAGQSYTFRVNPTSADLNTCGFVAVPFGVTNYPFTLANTDCMGYTAGTHGDRILLVVQSNQTLTVTMSSTAFDPYLRLIRGQFTDTSGPVIAQDDNGGGGTSARITFTNPSTDVSTAVDYTLEATSVGAGATGAYTLTITVSPAHYSAPPALSRIRRPAP